MSTILGDWVLENCSTIGQGSLDLSGSPDGFSTFKGGIPSGGIFYSILDGVNREAGIGVFDGDKLVSRDKITATLINGISNTITPQPLDLSGESVVFSTATNFAMSLLYAHVESSGNPHGATASDFGAEPSFLKNNAFNKSFGSGANDVPRGNHTHGEGQGNPTAWGSIPGVISDQLDLVSWLSQKADSQQVLTDVPLNAVFTDTPSTKAEIDALGVDAQTLDGRLVDDESSANTVVSRDAAKDVTARLFRSEYQTPNASINYIMTQADLADNNYIRPSTPSQVLSALGLSGLLKNSIVDGVSANTLVDSGAYRIQSNVTDTPIGVNFGQLLVVHGGGDTILQFVSGYSSSRLYWRSGNPSDVGGAGSWGEWMKITSSGSQGMVVGHNGDSPTGNFASPSSISIGDSDTGIRQNGDGRLELWANDQKILDLTSGQAEFHKDLKVFGNEVYHKGNMHYIDVNDYISDSSGVANPAKPQGEAVEWLAAVTAADAQGKPLYIPNGTLIYINDLVNIPESVSVFGASRLADRPFDEANHKNSSILLGPNGLLRMENYSNLDTVRVLGKKAFDGSNTSGQPAIDFFEGTGILLFGIGININKCTIAGFNLGIDSNFANGTGRLHLQNLNLDNVNDAILRNSLDVTLLENIQIWPFFGGTTVGLIRQGIGIQLDTSDWTRLTNVFSWGKQIMLRCYNSTANLIVTDCGVDNNANFLPTANGVFLDPHYARNISISGLQMGQLEVGIVSHLVSSPTDGKSTVNISGGSSILCGTGVDSIGDGCSLIVTNMVHTPAINGTTHPNGCHAGIRSQGVDSDLIATNNIFQSMPAGIAIGKHAGSTGTNIVGPNVYNNVVNQGDGT